MNALADNRNTPTLGYLSDVIAATAAVAETVRDLGMVTSGVLFAHLRGRMTLETYQSVVAMLVRTGLVREVDDVLTWVRS